MELDSLQQHISFYLPGR